MSNDHTFVVDVEATVEVRDANQAPKLTFSFPGLDDPLNLWRELDLLGWEIPERPPHPNPEIDWNKGAGQSYAVLPYRIDDFVVEAPRWPAHEVAERGLNTINLMRRLGVDLNLPIAYLDFLRRTQVSLVRDPSRREPIHKPTTIPNTLFLTRQPLSVLIDDPNIELYETAAGSNQPSWYWSESQRSVDDLFGNAEDRQQLIPTLGMGWELVSRMEAPPALDGRDRILRVIVRDVRTGSAMLDQLKGTVGDQCSSLLMRPIGLTEAATNCLLLVAIVPGERFSEVGQALISNFPDAIGRGRRFVPLGHAGAA